MPFSKRFRCSGRDTLGITMWRPCSRSGSACSSAWARKEACFWLSPSRITVSPGSMTASRKRVICSASTRFPFTIGAARSRRSRFRSRRVVHASLFMFKCVSFPIRRGQRSVRGTILS